MKRDDDEALTGTAAFKIVLQWMRAATDEAKLARDSEQETREQLADVHQQLRICQGDRDRAIETAKAWQKRINDADLDGAANFLKEIANDIKMIRTMLPSLSARFDAEKMERLDKIILDLDPIPF